MSDLASLRTRYLRDPLPIRLGGLAANLARIHAWSDDAGHREVVGGLLEESKFFIEWTATELALEAQAALVELQRQLARWQRGWTRIWADLPQRAAVAEQASAWSQQVLAMAGLLP